MGVVEYLLAVVGYIDFHLVLTEVGIDSRLSGHQG